MPAGNLFQKISARHRSGGGGDSQPAAGEALELVLLLNIRARRNSSHKSGGGWVMSISSAVWLITSDCGGWITGPFGESRALAIAEAIRKARYEVPVETGDSPPVY